MKLKIKVKKLADIDLPAVTANGDWIDLRSAEDFELKRGSYKLIPLGVAMKLPDGFEAVAVPRSSTYKHYKLIQTNHFGVIDWSFCGNNDQWHFPAYAMRDSKISKNDRICQFRIQLSQKATVWQKIKWLLSSGVEIVEVNELSAVNRGGIGSTGKK